MKRAFMVSIVFAIAVGAAAVVMATGGPVVTGGDAAATAEPKAVTLYKNPQCGCCEEYAGYLRNHGFTVTVKPTHDLVLMSRAAGIPDHLHGCHLAYVDDYVVSGHVPVNVVDRLLSKRPDIKGISLPGMPMGSPGMAGPKSAPFTIYEISDGPPTVYAVE